MAQDVRIKITTEGAKRAKSELKGVQGSIASMGKAVAGVTALYYGAKGLISGFGKIIELAGEQERAEKKLEIALGKRSQALLDQASALQQVTIFGDEAILGVQASIGAFLDSEEQIAKATEATLDIASAMGMDLKSAGDLVAKTLGSSTNAMSRYGIEVEGAVGSTERLESMTKNVARLFGGQAKAEAETMAGSIEQMKNAIGDAGEVLGDLFSPLVITTAEAIKNLAEGVGRVTEKFKNFGKEVDAHLLTPTDLANQELSEFTSTLEGKTIDELISLGKELEGVQTPMLVWNDSLELVNNKLEAIRLKIVEINIKNAPKKPIIDIPSEEENILPDVIIDMKEMDDIMNEAFADSGKGIKEQISLAGALGSALSTAFDPDLGAGEAFKGFVLQLMGAMQGVILASKAMSEALTVAFVPGIGAGVAIASLVALEIAKAGVRGLKFADGGIVPGMGNQDSVPAMLTPGEVILNKAQQKNLVGGMGGVTVNINSPVGVDESIVDVIIPAISQAVREGRASI